MNNTTHKNVMLVTHKNVIDIALMLSTMIPFFLGEVTYGRSN